MDKITRIFNDAIYEGWKICSCSCMCGGKYAWLKPTSHGSHEMYGCICHNLPDIEIRTKQEKEKRG